LAILLFVSAAMLLLSLEPISLGGMAENEACFSDNLHPDKG